MYGWLYADLGLSYYKAGSKEYVLGPFNRRSAVRSSPQPANDLQKSVKHPLLMHFLHSDSKFKPYLTT